jgi:predicted RNA binding protein YcfA (HicA-like mRNA interferase family)
MVLAWYYFSMPPKIRELLSALKSAGFMERSGKGSHRNFIHASGARITISGATTSDAKLYQEKAVKAALEQVSK